MNIRKAVITVASPHQRKLPLQTLIDREGNEKSVLEILLDEVQNAGAKEVALVHFPGEKETLGSIINDSSLDIHFIEQTEPRGYAHAIYCASSFVADDPFLHLVGDHLYVNKGNIGAAKHLVEVAIQYNCSVSAVSPTRENLIPLFGVIGGSRLSGSQELYQIEKVIEKPTPTEAEQKLIVPGLRTGHYLCFFGMHVLTNGIMLIIKELLGKNGTARPTLSDALDVLSNKEKYLALEKHDLRFDLGTKYGLMKAQIAVALSGKDRDRVLSEILEFFVMKDLNNLGK